MYRLHAGDMSLVNRCILFINRCLAFNIASMAMLGEKLCGRPVDHSPGLGVVSGALFSREQYVLSNAVDGMRKVATYMDCHRKRTWGVRGLAWKVYVSCVSGFPLYGVHHFESPRLLDMSNRLFVTVSA
jgi:hypothetical protein